MKTGTSTPRTSRPRTTRTKNTAPLNSQERAPTMPDMSTPQSVADPHSLQTHYLTDTEASMTPRSRKKSTSQAVPEKNADANSFDSPVQVEILLDDPEETENTAGEVELEDNELSDELDLTDPDETIIDVDGDGNTLPVPSTSRLPSVAGTKDSLHLYLREISRFPLLKPGEDVELARLVRDSNDSDAAFRLVSSHLRLVVKIAMDFQRRWMQNVLDLVQEGNVGLMRAVNKFDPEKGIKFSYYASFWIKAYILKFIMDNWRMVKVGTTQAQRKLFYNLNKERQKLTMQGFDPDATMLSERLNVTVEQIREMEQRLDTSDVSLDTPLGDDSGSSRMEFLPALTQGVEEHFAGNEIAELVQKKLQEIVPKLSEKEIYILRNRLLTDDPVTLREIGERYNITRERVRQLEARLLQKLHGYMEQEFSDFSSDWMSGH